MEFRRDTRNVGLLFQKPNENPWTIELPLFGFVVANDAVDPETTRPVKSHSPYARLRV